jgi:hypothetical protein
MARPIKVRKPRNDDRLVWNIQFAVWGTPAVFVAHKLKPYSFLAGKPRSLNEICAAKGHSAGASILRTIGTPKIGAAGAHSAG